MVALVLAVAVVSFLHLVVGEMAPKSWAISRPGALGGAAGAAVPGVRHGRPAGCSSRSTAWPTCACGWSGCSRRTSWPRRTARTELRLLLESSREHGTLGAAEQRAADRDAGAAGHHGRPGDDAVRPDGHRRRGRAGARDRADQPARAAAPGSRCVGAGRRHRAASCTSATPPGPPPAATPATAERLMTAPLTLPADTARGRRGAQRCASTVRTARGRGRRGGLPTVGVVALEDLLEEVIGEFDDETDPIVRASGVVRRAGR